MSAAAAGGAPLAGLTVVVTRPRDDAQALVAGIEALGGEALVCPALRIEYAEPRELEERLGNLAAFQWLVLTSVNAVRSLAPLFGWSRFSGKIAVVGSATAKALRALGYEESIAPPESTGAALASAMREYVAGGDRVLLPQSDIAIDALAMALGQAGATVVRVVSYRTRPGTREDAGAVVDRLGARIPDIVLFASPSAVRGLAAMLTAEEWKQLMDAAAIVSIGPTTSAQITALGLRVAREANPHTNEGLLDALRACSEGRKA